MMYVWSHRPRFLHLGLFFVAYVLGCGFAQLLAIVPGTGISIWPPAGLFIATLVIAPRASWPWWILAGCLAELFSNFVWFHSPLPAAFLIYVGNALEAATGAWLVNRTCRQPVRLETLQEVLAFVVLAAGIAPIVSATIGSATLAWFGMQSQTFTGAWPLWWIGDATGVLIVAPLALVVFQNWRGETRLSPARWVEACILGLIFLGVAALSLSGYLPFAYIIMPPLLWAAVRFEFKGAAVSLTVLALITAVFTVSDASQFAGDPESQRHRQIMLQLFLAISAFSALVVAAISRQHHQAVLTLRQNERWLQQLIDTVPALIWSTTHEGKPTYVNKRFTDVTGATLEDITAPDGSPSLSVIHPLDRAEAAQTFAHSFKTGTPYVMRYRQLRRDGSHRWTETRAEPLRDDSGAIVEWYGVSVDINDQVTAQAVLRERERELSQLVDMVPSHLWRLTPDGEPTFFNKRMVDFLGLDVADTEKPGISRLEAVITTVIHPDDAAKFRDALNHSLATGERFSLRYRLRRADGIYRWMSSSAEPMRDQDGHIVQWYGLCHDIDDQMQAEETLCERERELSMLVDMVPSNLWRLTPDGVTTLANKHMADYLGMDLSDKTQLETAFNTIFHPDDVDAVWDVFGRCLSTGERFSMKYRLRRWDGVYRWMSGRAEPLRDQNGQIVQWFGLCHDIDDQIHAEEALRQNERRLQQTIDAVPVRIWSMNPKGGPIYFNKRYQDYLRSVLPNFDTLEEPRVEKFVEELIHPEEASGVMSALRNCFTTGHGAVMRFRWREKDGEYRWAECRVEPRHDEDGAIAQWYGASIDIDDEVQAQEALRRASEQVAQATRAASLAELSASIAHEVNQPLAAIVANSHACHRWLSAEPPNVGRAKITAERITRDANSAADVVNRIRALFRRTQQARSPEDVNQLIGEVARLMADETAAKDIRMKTDLSPDLPPVALDRVQVQQVIVNLIRNGIEAMDNVADGARVLRIRSRREGPDAIRVDIRDTGPGFMDVERVFEPFFTTKENGMGMGLAICRSIVESHGGRLWAERNEPQGATFLFTLPVEMKTAS
ncbi:PAS domain-containing protein [Taklimakanibacter deserti]|uniref:PAS domain-containing protein n=1 Tax=Taklimakanibacter deserti TaxID=2267839 RepID=UPI000E653D50